MKGGNTMRKEMEMQGPDLIPEELEDEVYIRDEEGELVKLEVADDVEDD